MVADVKQVVSVPDYMFISVFSRLFHALLVIGLAPATLYINGSTLYCVKAMISNKMTIPCSGFVTNNLDPTRLSQVSHAERPVFE